VWASGRYSFHGDMPPIETRNFKALHQDVGVGEREIQVGEQFAEPLLHVMVDAPAVRTPTPGYEFL